MSGADKLKSKILSEAEAQADQVLDNARQRTAVAVGKGEQEAAARMKTLLEQARLQAEERLRRAKTIADLDARKAILSAKEDMIEDSFKQALERLLNLEAAAYTEILFPMLLAAAQTGREEIIVSPKDSGLYTQDFLDRVNQALIQQGKEGKLTLSGEKREMQGGFILRFGDVEINASFNSILRMQRDQLEPEVAAILFID
ncbi:MAG: V-type ATP synthase subunit E [Dethiobacter sp.]|jgi:V/A-type H+-transporting ATPase subunit E|nr:V-type ATP synthase subunit E [Dethiobacter sp.]